jgi:phosphomannomutase
MGDWWCNVRASNTEPLLRLNLEATSANSVETHLAAVAPLLGTRVAH